MKTLKMSAIAWRRAAWACAAAVTLAGGAGCSTTGDKGGAGGFNPLKSWSTPKPAATKTQDLTFGEDDGVPLKSKLSVKEEADLHFTSGRSMETQGKWNEAIACYDNALKLNPQQPGAVHRKAVALAASGKFPEAEMMFGAALEQSPGNPDIFTDMAYAQYLQGKYPEAERNLRQAIAIQFDHARAHNNLGMTLARMNRADEAMMAFHRGGCSEAAAHSNVGLAMMLEDRPLEARDHYRLALKRDSTSMVAAQGLDQADSLIARFRERGLLPAEGKPTGREMLASRTPVSLPNAPVKDARSVETVALRKPVEVAPAAPVREAAPQIAQAPAGKEVAVVLPQPPASAEVPFGTVKPEVTRLAPPTTVGATIPASYSGDAPAEGNGVRPVSLTTPVESSQIRVETVPVKILGAEEVPSAPIAAPVSPAAVSPAPVAVSPAPVAKPAAPEMRMEFVPSAIRRGKTAR